MTLKIQLKSCQVFFSFLTPVLKTGFGEENFESLNFY